MADHIVSFETVEDGFIITSRKPKAGTDFDFEEKKFVAKTANEAISKMKELADLNINKNQ